MVFSGRDGELIAKAAMPDQKETYMSVVLHDLDGFGNPDVIFGTGGETIGRRALLPNYAGSHFTWGFFIVVDTSFI